MNPGVNPLLDAVPTWRRWAVKLARHAALVLPGARSPWAEAMRRELDYIEDDGAALRWALGCVVASYKARLAVRPGPANAVCTWAALRHVAACGALMLVIGFALLENAESQTEPPRPAADLSSCDPPPDNNVLDTGRTVPSGTASDVMDCGHPAGVRASRTTVDGCTRNTRAPAHTTSGLAPETCAGRNMPVRMLPAYQTR